VFVYEGKFAIVKLAVYEFEHCYAFLWEFHIRKWSAFPTVLVQAPGVLVLLMRRL
jgi:hypothetical protein